MDGRLMVTVRLNFYLVIAVKPPPARSGSEKADASQGWTFGLACLVRVLDGQQTGGRKCILDPYQEVGVCEKRVPLSLPVVWSPSSQR